MIEKTLAKRYAAALLAVARTKGEIDPVAGELEEMAASYDASPDLRRVLSHPRIPRARKEAVLTALVKAKVRPYVFEFLRLLVRRLRIETLPDVAAAFRKLADEARGVARAVVESYRPLEAAHRSRLVAVLARILGREVLLEERANAALLGGFRVRVGDTVFDDSVAAHLRGLEETMLASEQMGIRPA